MDEIQKLRKRLKNVQKNVSEYRMTVTEAKELLNEIDILLVPEKQLAQIVVSPPVVVNRIIDGGDFF